MKKASSNEQSQNTHAYISITGHKQMEEKLRESLTKLNLILSTIEEGIDIVSYDYIIQYQNKFLKDRFGDATGKKCYVEYMGSKKPCTSCPMRNAIKHKKKFRVEATGKDGRTYEITSMPLEHPDGQADALEIIKDTTERKRNEEFLRESEEKYRNLIENSKDSIVIIDLKGNIQFANKVTEELTGYTMEKVIGMNIRKVTPKKYWPKSLTMLLKARRDKPIPYFETAVKRKDGTLVSVESGGQAIFRDGKAVGVQIITRDISQRKQAEEELEKSEAKYRSLVESSGVGITTTNVKGEFTFTNDTLCKMIGYSQTELIGKPFADFIHPDDKKRILQIFWKAWKYPKRRPSFEFRVIHKKGYSVHMHSTPTLFKCKNKIAGFNAIIIDITERKQAEETLRKSEEKARGLLELWNKIIDTTTVWIDLLDREGNVTSWNLAAELISGYSKREVIGHKKIWEKLYPDPEYRTKVFTQAKELILKGKYHRNYHTIIRCKDGAFKTISWHSNSILDEKGNARSSIAIGIDVTEIEKAQEKIRESEQKFRTLFENARDMIVTFDLDGNVTAINKACTECGFKKDKIIGRNMFNFVSEKSWPKLLKEATLAIQGKLVEDEIEIVTPKGKIIAEYRANPIKEENKIMGVQAIIRNITERKQMEERLRQYSERLEELVQKRTQELLESEKRYSILVEEASDGIIIVQNEKIVLINKKAAETFGYSKDESIELPVEKLVDEKHQQLVKEIYGPKMREKAFPATLEIGMITKKGEHILVEISNTLIDYQSHPAILVIMRDVRDRKRMEEQRSKLEKMAAMGQMATMVAHDLRNPLTSIRNAGYYIKNSCPCHEMPRCKAAVEMLDIIEQETIFANNIINDLLDFAASRPLQKKRQNVNKLVETSLMSSNIPENIKVERKLAEKVTAVIDEQQLKRVFLNLIKNAVQAMPNSGKLTIKTSETKDHIEIAFTDSGRGISEENMDRLFQPLFTTKAKGIGIGLVICKRIVEQHGGTVELQSKVGKGTTSIITLPKTGGENSQCHIQ